GRKLDREALEEELEQLGDSLLVVGDESAIKVHVHTNDPGAALSFGTRAGTIDRIEIANMHDQTHKREERLLAAVPDAPPALTGSRTAADNAREMREAVAGVSTGEVTIASRDVQLNGIAINKGDWLGLAAGKPVARGEDFDDVTYAVVQELLREPRELLTLLVGEDEEPLDGLLGRIAK